MAPPSMDQRFDFVRRTTTRIVIGTGVEARLPELVRSLGVHAAVVVHDPALPELAARVAGLLGGARCLAAPSGGAPKTLAAAGQLAERLRAAGADRGTAIVALGGGAVTDSTGFVASIYLRGVPFVACPTTTLAVCDAALGGKNGVDHGGLKNELGTIRQPAAVVGDVAWLRSLPDALFREGFVEAVKKAAVLDAGHFARLEQLAPQLAARDDEAVLEAIEMAIAMKMSVVLGDETERDHRRWLNFGHTLGHALESHAAGALRHGECIAIGMLAECRAAGAVVPASVTARITAVLTALGAPVELPARFADLDALWSFASRDKKALGARVAMIVPNVIGAGLEVPLTREQVAQVVA